MPPRKSKRATSDDPPVACPPVLPQKIEVEVLPTPPQKHPETSDEALVKDLRSKLRKSQMRVREMEKVISTSMISLVHTHPHLATSHPTSTKHWETSHIGPASISSDDNIVQKAKQIVQSHDRIPNPNDVQASRRSLQELEYTLDTIDRKIGTLRKKNRELQQRYGRIQASINRELWKAKVKGDVARETYLLRLSQEQSGKFEQIRSSTVNEMQSLASKKELIMLQHKNVDTTVSEADQASRSLRVAIDSLRDGGRST